MPTVLTESDLFLLLVGDDDKAWAVFLEGPFFLAMQERVRERIKDEE